MSVHKSSYYNYVTDTICNKSTKKQLDVGLHLFLKNLFIVKMSHNGCSVMYIYYYIALFNWLALNSGVYTWASHALYICEWQSTTELKTEWGLGGQGCNSFQVNDSNVSLIHKQSAFRTLIPDSRSGKENRDSSLRGGKLRSHNYPKDEKETTRQAPDSSVKRKRISPLGLIHQQPQPIVVVPLSELFTTI